MLITEKLYSTCMELLTLEIIIATHMNLRKESIYMLLIVYIIYGRLILNFLGQN